MCRKLSIAMSLIGDAKLIIMDEPTSNLDLRSREKIWRLLSRLVVAENKTSNRAILIST
jgi:ABC-type dipeptide/oligopeptide/nickel transport system ATPase component